MTQEDPESPRRRRVMTGIGVGLLGLPTGVGAVSGANHSDEHEEPAVTWTVPTVDPVDENALGDLEETITEVLGAEFIPEVSIVDGEVQLTASEVRGRDELLHPVLDVSGPFLQKEFGQPGVGIVDSTIAAMGNDDGLTVQPSIELSSLPSEEAITEIEQLAALVIGVEVAVDAEGTDDGVRVFVDTGVSEIGHIPIDVIEITARRIAERENIDVLDEDAHPIVAREPVTDGLGENDAASGPINPEAGDPLTPFPKDEAEADELAFDLPVQGPPRAAWHIPTGTKPTHDTVTQLLDVVEDKTGVRPEATATDNGVLYEVDEQAFVHPVLDIAESAAVNALGQPDVQGTVQSTIFAAGDRGVRSVQLSFGIDEEFSEEAVDTIEFLLSFVVGVDVVGYHENGRFFLDSDADELDHFIIEIVETVVRRTAAVEGVTITDDDAHKIAVKKRLSPGQSDHKKRRGRGPK